jgi:hypothetical protein
MIHGNVAEVTAPAVHAVLPAVTSTDFGKNCHSTDSFPRTSAVLHTASSATYKKNTSCHNARCCRPLEVQHVD